jgi:ribonuclease III
MGIFGWLQRFLRHKKPPIDIAKVESALGYHFTDPFLLFRSLKHRSYSQVTEGTLDFSNERLEFLGDSVLNLVVAHALYTMYPTYSEGDLTKVKSILVSKSSAAKAGKDIGLDTSILLSDSEQETGGRSRISIISDAYEAVIGAIFLDGGLLSAREFIQRTLLTNISQVLGEDTTNFKSMLLEHAQAEKQGHPIYHTLAEDGPDHNKVFTVEVSLQGKQYGVGKGKSKKEAQQMAAKEGLKKLQIHEKERV